ncbi:MAG: OmpA family protein [Rhizobiaceae bacterium]|nr:OmpA family protein [Rhizobiaceae bacterium]
MRAGVRKTQAEEEEESVFVSMTDMTVSFLFILMLLLAFFASQYSDTDMVPRKELEIEREQRKEAEAEVVRLQELIEQRDERITKLEKQILAQQAEIKQQNRQIAKLKKEIEELKQRLKISDPLEAYLANAAQERRRILKRLRDQLRIDFPDLKVEVSEQSDALRFQGDGLFATNSFELRDDRKAIVTNVAKRLGEILPCYTMGTRSAWNAECNNGGVIIEALQIEGHTDGTGKFISNLALSTNRANTTFLAMTQSQPGLIDFQNLRGQPVMSVAGYGQMRPVADNATRSGRDTNRRVDLRIIMFTPGKSEEIARIRKALESGGLEGTEK